MPRTVPCNAGVGVPAQMPWQPRAIHWLWGRRKSDSLDLASPDDRWRPAIECVNACRVAEASLRFHAIASLPERQMRDSVIMLQAMQRDAKVKLLICEGGIVVKCAEVAQASDRQTSKYATGQFDCSRRSSSFAGLLDVGAVIFSL